MDGRRRRIHAEAPSIEGSTKENCTKAVAIEQNIIKIFTHGESPKPEIIREFALIFILPILKQISHARYP